MWFVILGVTYAGGPKNECELFFYHCEFFRLQLGMNSAYQRNNVVVVRPRHPLPRDSEPPVDGVLDGRAAPLQRHVVRLAFSHSLHRHEPFLGLPPESIGV